MATAKPKVKRMMLGGVAKGALNSVKNAVAAKAAPMNMQNAARSAAAQAAPKSVPAYAQPYVNKMQSAAKPPAGMQFMSNALRSGAMKKGGTVKKKAVKK